MHRVELKVPTRLLLYTLLIPVPNAPCGVESLFVKPQITLLGMFLMHRVELKAKRASIIFTVRLVVPNAPCGVESLAKKSFGRFPTQGS